MNSNERQAIERLISDLAKTSEEQRRQKRVLYTPELVILRLREILKEADGEH